MCGHALSLHSSLLVCLNSFNCWPRATVSEGAGVADVRACAYASQTAFHGLIAVRCWPWLHVCVARGIQDAWRVEDLSMMMIAKNLVMSLAIHMHAHAQLGVAQLFCRLHRAKGANRLQGRDSSLPSKDNNKGRQVG